MADTIHPKLKSIGQFEKDLATKSEDYWIKAGQRMSLRLFHLAAQRVPAYQKFLKEHGIDPARIKTIHDFPAVPPVTKKNYLQAYPLQELCWDGKLASSDMISVSSGSSGKPTYWPRSEYQDRETMLTHELFLRDSFAIDRHSTLFIVSFSMGVWVAGTLTYRVLQEIAQHYPMTVVTPSMDKEQVLRLVQELGPHYQQIIIAGYPPFVKDVVDEGEQRGVEWKKMHIKFLFAAESFSEPWRDYMYHKIGAQNTLKDSLNIYGTADALILGQETPLSVLTRRISTNIPDLHTDIFSRLDRVPTLAQYNPMHRYFEQEEDQLIFSAYSGIPLVRYAIGDNGGLIPFGTMAGMYSRYGRDISAEAKENGISLWQLPFVYILGRSDFNASLYGITIYPEMIRAALEQKELDEFTTGKFTMITKNDERFDQYLEINVELQDKPVEDKTALAQKVTDIVVSTLRVQSHEYEKLYTSLGAKVIPKIILHPYEDPKHFTPSGKQRWHKKENV